MEVWKMTKTQLVDEIDERLAAKGQYVAFPSRSDRLRWGKTELENECASLRDSEPCPACAGIRKPPGWPPCSECGQ